MADSDEPAKEPSTEASARPLRAPNFTSAKIKRANTADTLRFRLPYDFKFPFNRLTADHKAKIILPEFTESRELIHEEL